MRGVVGAIVTRDGEEETHIVRGAGKARLRLRERI
jgi:hypothetical protein